MNNVGADQGVCPSLSLLRAMCLPFFIFIKALRLPFFDLV